MAGRKRLADRERRALLRSVVMGGAVVGVSLLGWLPVARAWKERLRPPGAIEEDEFLAACIKCGQCVQVCPVEAIVLADADEGFGIGVPYIAARDQACDFSCDAVQCVLACPTGALVDCAKPEDARMGFAKVERPAACLAVMGQGFKGIARDKGLHRYMEVDRWNPIPIKDHPYDVELCDLCVRECPIDGAISLQPLSDAADDRRAVPVIHATCVGCGMCEMICPVEPAVIVMDPRATAPADAPPGRPTKAKAEA